MNIQKLRDSLKLYDLIDLAEDAAMEASEELEHFDKKKELTAVRINMNNALISLNLALSNFKLNGVN